jgi:signal transduction histidine kinase
MAAEVARRRLGTVRTRTTLAASLVVGVTLVVGAVALAVALRRVLVRNLDSTARAQAGDVAALAGQGALPAALAAPGEEDALVQVVDASGRVVSSSANLHGQSPIATFRPPPGRPQVRTISRLPIGDYPTFRVAGLTTSSAGGPVTVYAASSLEQVEETLTAVRRILVGGLPVLLGVIGVTTWLLVGRALHPVEAIRAEVADISAHDLGRRVPVPAVADEIGRLAGTMNQMLDRLQSSADRQRRFAADASHELQSPLASSRAHLEVALAHPDDAPWASVATDLLEENHRMERLVRDLLFLARGDEGDLDSHRRPVDLDDVVSFEVGRLRPGAEVVIDASGVVAAEVSGHADQLHRVVRNLLENAVDHARSRVTIELRGTGAEVELVVADDGPGVPVPDRDRVFDRFTRLDDARSRQTGGAGLGLAIAREVVEAHGGRVRVEDGPGARFVVRLPAAG